MPAHFHRTPRRNAGFSLVELAVVVAVMAIIMAIGLPSLRDVIANNRLSSTTNEVLSLMQLAKIESIRRNVTVDVCAANALGTACDGAGNWSRIIVVANSATPAVVREFQASNRVVIRVNTNISASTGGRIRFRPEGFAWRGTPTTARLVNGRIQVCTPAPGPTSNARNIVVSGARASVDAPAAAGATCNATIAN